jgi:putative transposase
MTKTPSSNGSKRPSSTDPRSRKLSTTDLEFWPTVDACSITNLGHRARYRRLESAVLKYARGVPMSDVAAAAGLTGRRFYRILDACLTVCPDGRILGYRALVQGTRRGAPVRRAARAADERRSTAGYSGLFGKLLREHPKISDTLVKLIRARSRGRVAPQVLNFAWIHKEFLKACVDEKLTDADYPLSTESEARRPLRLWLKHDFMALYARDWYATQVGPDQAQAAGFASGTGEDTRPEPAHFAWQIDEQTVDALARYDVLAEDGNVDHLDLERFQVIRVLAIDSGASVAWSMVIGRQIRAYDLLAVLWDGLNGQPPAAAAIQGLVYQADAGYPACVIPELRFALPGVIYLDNALAHLAEGLQRLVAGLWGAKVRIGRPGVPQERAEVESHIKQMATQLLHQLPATTGSEPRSSRRKKARCAVKHRLDVMQLRHVIDVYLANKNGLPAAASRYQSPLMRLRSQVASGRMNLAELPEPSRRAHLFFPPLTRDVKCDLDSGRKPHINFEGARYTSDKLKDAYRLVGSKFVVRCDPRDLRTIWLYDIANGHEWGQLTVLGRWASFPHDLRLRQWYLKLKRENEWGEQAAEDPLERLYSSFKARRGTSRPDAMKYAYLMSYLEGWTDAPASVAAACHQWRSDEAAQAGMQTVPMPAPTADVQDTAGVDGPQSSDAAPAPGASAPAGPPPPAPADPPRGAQVLRFAPSVRVRVR